MSSKRCRRCSTIVADRYVHCGSGATTSSERRSAANGIFIRSPRRRGRDGWRHGFRVDDQLDFPLLTYCPRPRPHPLSAYAPPPTLDSMAAILQLANDQLEGGIPCKKSCARVSSRSWRAVLPAAALAQSCNTADRSVLLILDASGSMNAKLPNGETRIAVAQRAIKGVAGFIPAQAQLSLRMYGAQSPASQKNCQDTHLAVPFGAGEREPAAPSRRRSTAPRRKATRRSPIRSEQAANDFPADAKERVIVLVSDGKETCQGDPVVAAKALAAKGITVHTVGFIVDTAARGQLQAIARATGGTYFDAPVGPELPDTLKSALNACKKRVVTLPPKPQPGKLRTTSATWLTSHAVLNAETGQKVGDVRQLRTGRSTLPAGIYEVKFGPASWKGIEVRPGETTTIEPGVLKVEVRAAQSACQREPSSIPKPARSMEVSTPCRRR